MNVLGMTHSTCPDCRTLVPARVESDGQAVYFRKHCPEHGEQRELVSSDVGAYLAAQRIVKPAWVPREFAGAPNVPCPDACGFCPEHEQHLCLPIVEITTRCDLACPVCLTDAGSTSWDMTLDEFRRILDNLARAERQIDILNLSGGEPLLHPDLLGFVDAALSRDEFVRISISTNGLQLLARPDLLKALHDRNVVISLQFDGFEEKAYEFLRGRKLLREKLEVLGALQAEAIATSLTMTAAAGVNDDQFGPMLDYLFAHDHVVSMMIQPLVFEGRAANLARTTGRLTTPDVIKALGGAGHSAVSASDFLPLPCSSALCFSLAFYLILDSGEAVSVNRLVDAEAFLEGIANRVIFGLDADEHDRLKSMIYKLWSGPAAQAPDGEAVIGALRGILRELSASQRFDPRAAFEVAERRVKSIFVHAFQDAHNFDLARARRCCQAYPQPDGTQIPACVRNVLCRGMSPTASPVISETR